MKNVASLFLLFLALSASKLFSQCSSPSSVPYYEGFQGITSNNQLPNCWLASNLAGTCLTFTTPNVAAFTHTPSGTSYFYSIGIQLYTGVSYSASIWHKNSSANSAWSNLAVSIATAQAAAGLVNITSTSPVNNSVYSALSATFNVAVTGTYYIAISATSSGTSSSQYLYWDDLSITIPCQLVPNTPTVTIAASSPFMCGGLSAPAVTLTAMGADTYSWSTGASTASSTSTPGTATYLVIGNNTLTGCFSTATKTLLINPSPNLVTFSGTNTICSGESVKLTAVGPSTVVWGNSGPGFTISVSPTVSTTYSVTGLNSLGCSTNGAITIMVNNLPTVGIIPGSTELCKNEVISLMGTGALTYSWFNNPPFVGQTFTSIVSGTTTFSVTGQDQNGCKNSGTLTVVPSECTELSSNLVDQPSIIYPTVTKDLIFVKSQHAETYEVLDFSGKVLLRKSLNNVDSLDLSQLAPGVYFLMSKDKRGTSKIIKVE